MIRPSGHSQKHSGPYRPAKARALTATTSLALVVILAPRLTWISPPTAAGYHTKCSPSVHTARALNVTDTAHLHLVSSPGSLLIEEGPASGNLPGTIKTHLNVGPTVNASFTIYTKDGTLSGHGTAKLNTSGRRYDSFAGTMYVTNATGHYTHAHGQGGLYGTLDRKTDALTVQTTGTLTY